MGNIISDCEYCNRSDKIKKQKNKENQKKATSFKVFYETNPNLQIKDYSLLKQLYDEL